MKAVNLVPVEERRNTTVAGHSGGGVYILLGALALIVVLVSAYALTGRQVSEKRSELAQVSAEATRVEAEVARLQAYQRFAELRAKRTETVLSLARSRFDWAGSLREVARTVPAGVSLTALTGTVAPGVNVDGGATDALRAALPGPALVVQGCTRSQEQVAELMSALRSMTGVERVALSTSEKGSSSGSTGDCTGGSTKRPKFSLTVFFSTAAVSATPGSPAPGTTTAAATGATP